MGFPGHVSRGVIDVGVPSILHPLSFMGGGRTILLGGAGDGSCMSLVATSTISHGLVGGRSGRGRGYTPIKNLYYLCCWVVVMMMNFKW